MHQSTDLIKGSQIDQIIGKAKINKEIHYLVIWKDLPSQDASWESARMMSSGSLDVKRKNFNKLIEGIKLPVIIEQYAESCKNCLKWVEFPIPKLELQKPKKKPEMILGKQKRGKKMYFLVKWQDQPIQYSTWEPRYLIQGIVLNNFIGQTRWVNKLPYIDQKYLSTMRKLQKQQKKQRKILCKNEDVSKQNKLNFKNHQDNPQKQNIKILRKQSIKLEEQQNQTYGQGYLQGNSQEFDKIQELSRTDERQLYEPSNANNGKQLLSQQIDSMIKKIADIVYSQRNNFAAVKHQQSKNKNLNYFYEESPINKIQFIQKVKKTLQYQNCNLYNVRFQNGSIKAMKSDEISLRYPMEFIRYLQRNCQNHECFQ